MLTIKGRIQHYVISGLQKVGGLRFFTWLVLLTLLLSFVVGSVLSGGTFLSVNRHSPTVHLDSQIWYARRGFSDDMASGFPLNAEGVRKITQFPIKLNHLFAIPPGDQVNQFTLMTSFILPEGLTGHSIAITVGELGENWAVYLNGELIQSEIFLDKNGDIDLYRSVYWPLISIPDSLIKPGENVLVFRMIGNSPPSKLYSGDLPGFSVRSGFDLGDTLDLTNQRTWSTTMSYFQIGIYAFFGLFMFLFFRRRKEEYALLFSAFLLVFAGYSFFSSTAIYELLLNTAIIRRMMYCDVIICVPLIALCSWNFLWPNRPPSQVLKLTTLVCTLGMFLILLLPYRWIDTIFRIYIFPITAVLVYVFMLAMQAVRTRVTETKNILIASLIIVGIGIFSLLDEVYFKTGVDLISWAPLMLCVIYAFILTTRYWEMGVELVDINLQLQRNAAQLEEIVSRRTEELSDAKVELEQQLAEITSLQTTLNEQVMRDPLTGLYNRRFMEESLKKEFARAERKDYPISMVMFDIDHFKLLNDSYSHSAGDQVLVSLGRILSTHIRIDDYAIRYGGEEFLVVFPQTPYIKAMVRANQIRELVKKVVVDYLGNQLQITISGGVAGFPDHGRTPEEVIMNADRALYKAKELGRDRVEVYLDGEEMPVTEYNHIPHGLQTYE